MRDQALIQVGIYREPREPRAVTLGFDESGQPVHQFIDDDGTCHEIHPGRVARFHLFRDAKRGLIAMRCPLTLTHRTEDGGMERELVTTLDLPR